MPDIKLKYGCNPNQPHAKITTPGTGPMGDGPLTVVNGAPSYINALDAIRAWQLVRDLKAATGKAAAASFKHVSPAGAAVAGELSDDFRRAFLYKGGDYSPIATAYARARSSDRVASFGDFIAVSEPVDETLARLIKPEVSDGIVAPSYEGDAFEILRAKKGGRYVMLTMDPAYAPPPVESRVEFGLTLEQTHNDLAITADTFNERVTDENRTHRRRSRIPHRRHRHPQAHPEQLASPSPPPGRPSASAPASSPASPAPASPATKPTASF